MTTSHHRSPYSYDLRTDMTTHEQRLAAIQKQIEELEAENVAKKEWVLMGEASSKARPHDSLLQEDLEFERATKAVPVVTEEVVQGLEVRIKARISEGRFDDVVRRRPVDDKPFLPSRFFELQDTKSNQSLAQIYEGEYMAAQTGTSSDDRDGKLKKEHDEITKLWESICNKLDALCNAHYVPKQVCNPCCCPDTETNLRKLAKSYYFYGLRSTGCLPRVYPPVGQVCRRHACTRGGVCSLFI